MPAPEQFTYSSGDGVPEQFTYRGGDNNLVKVLKVIGVVSFLGFFASASHDEKGFVHAIMDPKQTAINAPGVMKSLVSDAWLNIPNITKNVDKIVKTEPSHVNSEGLTTTEIQIEPDKVYWFQGTGNDLIEGHGMGMSQWGAKGMADAGKTHKEILSFYYPGTETGDFPEPEFIVVDGVKMTFQNYLNGAGEVDESWPIEAILAQTVAYRTYALSHMEMGSDGFYHICGTDACQVYKGGNEKEKYVRATKGQVILYDGKPIDAYYSASHRGCSSKISTTWGGQDLPYIQSVNDSEYAKLAIYHFKSPYNGELVAAFDPKTGEWWQWQTPQMTGADLNNVFTQTLGLTELGTLEKIAISHDACGRVAEVSLIGTNSTNVYPIDKFQRLVALLAINPENDFYSTQFMLKHN
jgi:SpoIID/LytB domain protein